MCVVYRVSLEDVDTPHHRHPDLGNNLSQETVSGLCGRMRGLRYLVGIQGTNAGVFSLKLLPVARLIPAITKFHFSGKLVKQPLGKYNGQIPRVFCAGRPGFETLLRRLVIGRKHYPNIEQIHGTVIGYEKDPQNPTRICGVLVRQPNNEVVTISSTLILGKTPCIFFRAACLNSWCRLHRACEGWRKIDSPLRVRTCW